MSTIILRACIVASSLSIAAVDARAQSASEARVAESPAAAVSLLIVDTLHVRTVQRTSVVGPAVIVEKNATSVYTTTDLEVSGGSNRAYSVSLAPMSSARALPAGVLAQSESQGASAPVRLRRTGSDGRDVLHIDGQIPLPPPDTPDQIAALTIGIDYP